MRVIEQDVRGEFGYDVYSLYPCGTPVPVMGHLGKIDGEVVGFGHRYIRNSYSFRYTPKQVYIIEVSLDGMLPDDTPTEALKMVELLVVDPEHISGMVKCDPERGGCGEEHTLEQSVLHRWNNGKPSWLCQVCHNEILE